MEREGAGEETREHSASVSNSIEGFSLGSCYARVLLPSFSTRDCFPSVSLGWAKEKKEWAPLLPARPNRK